MVSMKNPDTGPCRGGPGGSGAQLPAPAGLPARPAAGLVPSLIACPECELPAEITDRFWLDSTDGPVDHVALACVDGHYFRMPADCLPAGRLPADWIPADRLPADRLPAQVQGSSSGVGSRLPGRLGTVRNWLPEDARDEAATASLT